MKKEIASVAFLMIIVALVLGYTLQEQRVEEAIIDSWDPITPSLLYPYPQNNTGWAFMSGPYAKNGTFLKLNISASNPVRVIIGKLVWENATEHVWDNIIFNETGNFFDQKVEIAGKPVNFLMLINEGTYPVRLSGNIRKMGNLSVSFFPYLSLATLIALSGLSLFVYALLTKPSTRVRKNNKGKAQKCD